MFPRHWYSQRARSESHTSSDVDQYQDAAEYLNLDTCSVSTSSSQISKSTSTSSSATDYLDLDVGSTHHHTPSLAPGSATSTTVIVADEVPVVVQVVSCDVSSTHHPTLSLASGSATVADEVPVAVEDIEVVSCDVNEEVDGSCDPLVDQSEMSSASSGKEGLHRDQEGGVEWRQQRRRYVSYTFSTKTLTPEVI